MVKRKGRGARRIREDLALLSAQSVFSDINIVVTEYAGHAVDVARESSPGSDLLVAVGGDGTLNEVLNGCMAAVNDGASPGMPLLGFVAGGTANDFLRSTPSEGTLSELLKLAARRSTRSVDLGRVDYVTRQGEPRSRYFINVADLGIGASVARRVNTGGRRFGANIAYFRAILAAFLSFQKPFIRLRSDAGLQWEGRALACVIGNGRCFGSGLCAVPEAVIDDGSLDLAIIGDVSLVDFLRKLPRLKRGQPIHHPEVVYHRARNLVITASGQRSAMELDGEYLDCGDVTVSVVPGAVTLLMP